MTGQNFSEDGFKYSHCVGILDTNTLDIELINNPYALNFYKIEINDEDIAKQYEDMAKQYGLTVEQRKTMELGDEIVAEHYAHLVEFPFYPSLREFMTSAPVEAIILSGENAVSRVRTLVGVTDSTKADIGTTVKTKWNSEYIEYKTNLYLLAKHEKEYLIVYMFHREHLKDEKRTPDFTIFFSKAEMDHLSFDELLRTWKTGQIDSLNASVAAGVLMYEVVRQRM